jgi:hypothetical protein
MPWISKQLGVSSRADDGESDFCRILCSTANMVRSQHDMRIGPLIGKVTSTLREGLREWKAVNLGSCNSRFTELKGCVLFGAQLIFYLE